MVVAVMVQVKVEMLTLVSPYFLLPSRILPTTVGHSTDLSESGIKKRIIADIIRSRWPSWRRRPYRNFIRWSLKHSRFEHRIKQRWERWKCQFRISRWW